MDIIRATRVFKEGCTECHNPLSNEADNNGLKIPTKTKPCSRTPGEDMALLFDYLQAPKEFKVGPIQPQHLSQLVPLLSRSGC